jgi:hypothetical protein
MSIDFNRRSIDRLRFYSRFLSTLRLVFWRFFFLAGGSRRSLISTALRDVFANTCNRNQSKFCKESKIAIFVTPSRATLSPICILFCAIFSFFVLFVLCLSIDCRRKKRCKPTLRQQRLHSKHAYVNRSMILSVFFRSIGNGVVCARRVLLLLALTKSLKAYTGLNWFRQRHTLVASFLSFLIDLNHTISNRFQSTLVVDRCRAFTTIVGSFFFLLLRHFCFAFFLCCVVVKTR